ncbi:MAG TPA: hypothetical protein VME66_05755 [Candidatus Acidoferrales bacterium]|nr:hypothetical protein [Candidatus Acidoferrales bacterium]
MARRLGYANAAAFIRARIFTSLDVRLAGELGAAVERIDAVLARGNADAKVLRAALLGVKVDLLAAGAIPRRSIDDAGAGGLVA